MRALRPFGLVVLVLLLLVPGLAAADEGSDQPVGAVAEKALEALRLRLEARIQEGELLARAGRLEEALAAYRSVGDLYEQGMERVQALVAGVRGAAPAAAPVRPEPDVTRVPRDLPGARARVGPRTTSGRGGKEAIDDGLRWLAAHQGPDGRWGAAEFANWCDGKPILGDDFRPDGLGKPIYDVGVTGLAVLAFLGAGHAAGDSPYALAVKKGVEWLVSKQDAEGCLGARSVQQYIYNHALGSLALLEAYGTTRNATLKGPCQKALDFIALARNPYFAWRYGIKPGDNDTSVTTWMVMALKSALVCNRADLQHGRPATFVVDEAAFDGARAWLDKVTDTTYGRVGYVQRGTGPARVAGLVDRFPGERSEAMTAAGIFARVLMGEDPRRSEVIMKGARLCADLPPVWNTEDGSIDMIYWYFGTLAMFQVGGREWSTWSRAMPQAMARSQRTDGALCDVKGSWDPVGAWGTEGGRVYSTALMCLCLEVNLHYNKVFGAK